MATKVCPLCKGAKEIQISETDWDPCHRCNGEGVVPDIQYPIGGYAPGNYTCFCRMCGKDFRGDKRAVQCEQCADGTTVNELVKLRGDEFKQLVPVASMTDTDVYIMWRWIVENFEPKIPFKTQEPNSGRNNNTGVRHPGPDTHQV